MMRHLERSLVVALCVAIGWFYVWTVRSSEPWKFGPGKNRDYYNLLINGYLAGQLHMKVEVPEALLTLSNPYNPEERPAGVGLHDASFYKGKYYVYFGAAPMIVLMLPFRLLTGVELPLQLAILIFVYVGFLVSAGLLLAVRRRCFPETRTVTVLLAVLVLGLASMGPVLLRRPAMWELPIASGYCFAMLTMAAIWRTLYSDRSRMRLFAAAGLWLGLAIASRPTYLIVAPVLIAPMAWWWWKERQFPWRMGIRVAAPLAIIGGLMAWHNYARFENPLEFGQAYQLSLDYESKLPHFRAAYAPFNVKEHFFSPAKWTSYFPFIQRADLRPGPEGYTTHRGDIYGILINFPIAWLAFLSPLALWRRQPEERGPLGAWLLGVALLFLLPAGLLLFFFSALARYQMEFVPAFMLLACVGLLGLERWLQQKGAGPLFALARVGWTVAAVASAAFGILYSLEFEGLLRERNPRLQHEVARRLNWIPAIIERVTGVKHGAVEMTLRMPTDPRSGSETLLTAGEPPDVDRLIVRYEGDARVRFGVVSPGNPTQLSLPVSLDPTAGHRARITMGSLYPPTSHPFFGGKSAEEIRRITRLLRIDVDGEPVLIAHYRTRNAAEGRVLIGGEVAADESYPRFRGSILTTHRLESEAPVTPRGLGPFIRLRLALNANIDGSCEPLISFGEAGTAAVLTVTQLATRKVKFAFVPFGAETIESPEIESEPRGSHELIVRFEATGQAQRRRILLWRDAELVWAREIPWDIREAGSIVVGKNRFAVPGCSAEFRGTIFSVQHEMQGRDPLAGPGGTIKLKAQLPTGRSGQREPLIVTGRSGEADLLIIEYVDAQTVRLALDHWGSPMISSELLPVDFSQPHTFDIHMPSLETMSNASQAGEPSEGRITVTLDGVRVWEHSAFFFAAEPEEVVIGRNTIGGTRCGLAFTGTVLAAERVSR